LDQLSWSAQYGTSKKCDYDGEGEPVLRIPNLCSGTVSLKDMKRANAPLSLRERDHVMPGDLLIVRTNGSKELIGRSGMTLQELPDATYFASYLIRYRLTGNMRRWQWIRAFTGSSVFRANVLASVASSAGQYNLSMGKLDGFAVAMPPDTEISEALDTYEIESAKCLESQTVDEMSGHAATLRQSILAAAFRGELTA
jgi:type I restriction enzyme S subunit